MATNTRLDFISGKALPCGEGRQAPLPTITTGSVVYDHGGNAFQVMWAEGTLSILPWEDGKGDTGTETLHEPTR